MSRPTDALGTCTPFRVGAATVGFGTNDFFPLSNLEEALEVPVDPQNMSVSAPRTPLNHGGCLQRSLQSALCSCSFLNSNAQGPTANNLGWEGLAQERPVS